MRACAEFRRIYIFGDKQLYFLGSLVRVAETGQKTTLMGERDGLMMCLLCF
jgi:hypothetical protein